MDTDLQSPVITFSYDELIELIISILCSELVQLRGKNQLYGLLYLDIDTRGIKQSNVSQISCIDYCHLQNTQYPSCLAKVRRTVSCLKISFTCFRNAYCYLDCLMFLNDILLYSFIFCLFCFVNISLALFALRQDY